MTARLQDAAARLNDWQFNALLLVGTRVLLTIAGFVGIAVLGEGFRRLHLAPDHAWLELWAQWDSEHYLNIATQGYSYEPGTFSNIPFFPLYPALIGIVLTVIGSTDTQTGAIVGFVIANIALFVALTYLTALVTRDMGLSTARRTVVYVLLFPTTLFLSAVYAESLFLATGAATLYHARRGEWYRAGLAGGLAALTRPYGFLLVVPIAVELWRQRARLRFWPSIALVPLGLATYMAYLWAKFDDPFLYFKANEVWGRGFHLPWETFFAYLRGPLVGFRLAVLVAGPDLDGRDGRPRHRRLVAHPALLLGVCRGRRPVRAVERDRLVLGLTPCAGPLPDHHHPRRARRSQPCLRLAMADLLDGRRAGLHGPLRGGSLAGLISQP